MAGHSAAASLAAKWLKGADAVLVCAGAGLSAKLEGKDGEGASENVYVNEAAFRKHYPALHDIYGYQTSYQCMGLPSDPNVPENVRVAYFLRHAHMQGTEFQPNSAYPLLRDLLLDKDTFFWTSNVDRCFARSGVSEGQLYEPQGSWWWLQCSGPCRRDAVFTSRPILDKVLPHYDSATGSIASDLLPRCPYCNSLLMGNVRGGAWFLHTPYDEQSRQAEAWVESILQDSSKRLVVLEIGAGFNTPTVTRFPMESIVRAAGDRGALIRINPSDPEVPSDLPRAIGVVARWDWLYLLQQHLLNGDESSLSTEEETAILRSAQASTNPRKADLWRDYQRQLGHFDWHRFLQDLRR